jgi:hypothetical protein
MARQGNNATRTKLARRRASTIRKKRNIEECRKKIQLQVFLIHLKGSEKKKTENKQSGGSAAQRSGVPAKRAHLTKWLKKQLGRAPFLISRGRVCEMSKLHANLYQQ